MLAVALLAGACGGAAEEQDVVASNEPASLAIIEAGVDVADAEAAEEFRPGQDGEGLVVDDQVRTQETGFAEVNWTVGALARIGPGSLYRVVELSEGAAPPQVVVRLDVGRAWNRLDTGSIDNYSVETSVGIASVRGTAFDVRCDELCTVGVVEGGVSFTTTLGIEVRLQPGEQVTVDADGVPGEVVPLVVDDWILDNVRLDEERHQLPPPPGISADGFTAEEEGERPDEAEARLDGQYFLEIEVTDASEPSAVGSTDTRRYTFAPSCEDGPCGGEWDTGAGPAETFTWTGTGYAAAYVDRDLFQLRACTDAGVPSWLEDFVLTLTPTAAELIDGQSVVTAFEGTWEASFDPHPDALEIGCNDPGAASSTVTFTGVREGPVGG